MTRELELAVNSGRIYAGMMKLAKEKQDFQKRVDANGCKYFTVYTNAGNERYY